VPGYVSGYALQEIPGGDGVGRVERLDHQLVERDVDRASEGRDRAEEGQLAVAGSQSQRDHDVVGRALLPRRFEAHPGIAGELVVEALQLRVGRERGLPAQAVK
jgi:hypothetical protein